jgi:hypothetical protein
MLKGEKGRQNRVDVCNDPTLGLAHFNQHDHSGESPLNNVNPSSVTWGLRGPV